MESLKSFIWRLLEGPSAEALIYKASAANRKGGKACQLARYYELTLRKRFACYISYKAKFGANLKLPHPVGIVIGDGVTVGNNVTIFQNVTLGAARMGEGVQGLYPKIEDGAVIFAGAKIIGAVNIGKNAIVAANAVVLHDIPENTVAVGIPAKVKASKVVEDTAHKWPERNLSR